MRYTFDEILSEKEWLHKELINSFTNEIFSKIKEDGFIDVKLLVNGIELEPKFYEDLIKNIEKYIECEAKSYVTEKLKEVDEKARELADIIEETTNKIFEDYNL